MSRRKPPTRDSSAPAPFGGPPIATMWPAMALAGLVGALYANTLHNPFVYDDVLTVVDNASIRDLSNLEYIFRGAVFRPLVNLSYAIDRHFWQLEPTGYHLTGILLHAANVVLLLALALFLSAGRGTAIVWAAPAALMAVHPGLTEAVGYVSARSELLSTFFALLSLLAFCRAAESGRWTWAVMAWVALLAGLASKEIAAAVPLLALLIDWLFLPSEGRKTRILRVYAGPLALIALGGGARLFIYFRHEETAAGGHFAQNLLLQVENVWRYGRLLVLPIGLSVVHEFREVESPFEAAFLLSAVGIVALVWAGWRFRTRSPLVTLGVAWFLIALAPSAVVPLNEGFSEHRCYFAACGLFLVVAEGLSRLTALWPGHPVPAMTVGLLAVLAAATVLRNAVWSDPVRLWSDAVEKAPRIFASHYALGDAYRLKGDCAAALPEYQEAVKRAPQRPDGWNNLGVCAARTGDLGEAGRAWTQAVSLQPNDPAIHYNLGLLARTQGDLATARAQLEETLRLAPAHSAARAALDALK